MDNHLVLLKNDLIHNTPCKGLGMCERFNKTMKQAFFDIAMLRKLYTDLASLQEDLDSRVLRTRPRVFMLSNVIALVYEDIAVLMPPR
jgi:hypothetical protein